MVNERRWLLLIFALYFLLAIGYSLMMPLWEAPTGAHYHLAWYLHYAKTYATPEKNYEAQFSTACVLLPGLMGTR